MARANLTDPAQSSKFMIFDVPSFGNGYDASEALLPLRLPYSAVLGAQSITMPEYTLTLDEINEGTLDTAIRVVIGAAVNNITLTRAVYVVDKEFFNWIRMTASGKANSEVFRRDLVLVWFHNAIGVSTGAHTGIGMVDNPRVPFKAWYLKDTIPVRYKPGADFDANSSAISIQELELAPRDIDELGLLDLGALIGVNVAL
jgi:phage tail-like protein